MAMAPGWYPDPFSSAGYVRYWDGQRWGASAPLPPGTPVPPPGQPLAAPPTAVPAAPAAGPPVPPGTWAPPPAPPTSYGAPPVPYGAPAQAAFPLATWGSRVVARIIDSVIEGVVLVPVYLWVLWPAVSRLVDSIPEDGQLPADALQTWITDVTSASVALTVVSLVVTFLYEVPQNVRWGRTLGKRVLGIRIRPLAADGSLGWGTATIRWGTEAVGAAVIGLLFTLVDYLWPLWDKPWRQALHDKTARTVVVPDRG